MEDVYQSRIYAVIFFLLAALGVGFVCYRVLAPFLAAIAWAIVLAVAFQKPWSFLERRMPRHRNLAAALLTLAIAAGCSSRQVCWQACWPTRSSPWRRRSRPT